MKRGCAELCTSNLGFILAVLLKMPYNIPMTDTYKLTTKLVLKVSDDLNSAADRHVVVYRGQGPWTNPDSWSLPSVPGTNPDDLAESVREKFGLETQNADWKKLGEVHNPANNEINHVWLCDRPVKEKDLASFFQHVAGVEAIELSALWAEQASNKKTMSPALDTIMQASQGSDNDEFRALFAPASDL